MKYQNQPTTFGPSQRLTSKKPLGPRMMKIAKEVQRSQTYMNVSALSRNIGANRRDDTENIGSARIGKTYDSSKSGLANYGQDNVVVVKPFRLPLGDNLTMSNANIFLLGKSKKIAVSQPSESIMPSSFRDDLVAFQSLKDSSRDTSRILKKPPHSSKVVASSKGSTSLVNASSVLNKEVKVVASVEGNAIGGGAHFLDEHEKEQSFIKEKEDTNSSSKSKCVLGMEDFRDNSNIHRRIETSCMLVNMKQSGGSTIKDSGSDNGKLRSKSKVQLKELPEEHDNAIEETKMVKSSKRRRDNEDGYNISGDDQNIVGGEDSANMLATQITTVEQYVMLPVLPEEHDNGTEENKKVKLVKRRRRYICDDEEDDDTSGGDQNIVGVEDGANVLTTQTAIMEQYGSLPVDEPIWSGMFKVESEGYVSLEAHLSAKSCEKVWKCSRSLENVVQVTKLSRLEAEPKSFKVSRPTEDNIGVYFFPQGMRPNEDFDKLVKEVMDNDLILRAYVDEAEMLIFPSILLPERHQTFKRKYYLWGLFKRRENKVNIEEGKQMHGTRLSGHEKQNGKQFCSRPGVGKQDIDKEEQRTASARSNALTRPAERAAATPTPARAACAATSPALSLPAECAAAGVVAPAPAATSNATSSPHPAERAAAEAAPPAPAATTVTEVHPGGMYGFIVRPNPRIQQLIQEMEREGAVVFAMRGEALGYSLAGQ